MKVRILLLIAALTMLCTACSAADKAYASNYNQASRKPDTKLEAPNKEPFDEHKFYEQVKKSGIEDINCEIVGYYGDHSYGASLPNHSAVKAVIFEGTTKLGYGYILLLERDKGTAASGEIGTYEAVYALIPIEGYNAAYLFNLDVPKGESANKYIEIMQEQLVAKEESLQSMTP